MTRTRVLLGAMATMLTLSLVAAPAAMAKGRPLQADLTGAAEVPGPGDEDGAGTAIYASTRAATASATASR